MSLLMDALRKAEEAKRTAAQPEGAAQSPSADFSTAPTPPREFPESAHAELALEPLPGQAARADAASGEAAAIRNKNAEQAQRQTIQNAFAAKTPAKKPEDKAFLLALACVAGLAAVGIGGYVWWQMQPRSSLVAATNVPPAAAVRPAPSPAVAAPLPTTEPLVAAEQAPPAADPVERSQPRPATSLPATPDPVRITRSQPRVNPLLERGYTALQQGDLAQAQQAYERMLGTDPKSVDAMYGLAAIALQRQQPGLAEDYYLRILEADPRDPYAHAGLAGLRGRAGGSNAESRLKALIAEQPGVAPLHFALGNLYAQDQRWRDAQQSYFLAYQNDSSSPDIAFNLAVSLDQLRQNRLAAQYYTEALRLAVAQPSAFNREQAQQRLRELQAAIAP